MDVEFKVQGGRFIHVRNLVILLGATMLLVAACQQPFGTGIGDIRGSSTSGDAGGSTAENPSSNEYSATFLPPLADDTGNLEAGARVEELAVRIRGVDSAGRALEIPDFTADGDGSERLREGSDVHLGDYYIVNFHLRRYVDAGSSLTIEVLQDGLLLASLDAEVVATGRQARDVTDAVALVSNRTVPVKFRVERLAVDPDPGFTVTYDGNEQDSGSPPVDDTSYDPGDEVDVLGNSGNLRRTGHGFVGWNSQAEGGGEFYEVGDTFTMPDGDVTLYAHWKDDYEVGDEGPAGGWVFYDHGELHADGWRFLEAGPEDIVEDGIETFEWSNVDRQSVGGTSTDLGSGADNTLAIIEQDGHESSAAQRTIDYATTQLESTFGDWFLPSLDELAELYNRLHENPESTFVEAEYWSSSESGSLSAQVLDFASGESATRGKSFLRRVRPIRAF